VSAACCSMLQHVAECCSALQCMLQCIEVCVYKYTQRFYWLGLLDVCLYWFAVCCSVLQCVATCCSVRINMYIYTHSLSATLRVWMCTVLQHTAPLGGTWQYTATHCYTLQQVATLRNTHVHTSTHKGTHTHTHSHMWREYRWELLDTLQHTATCYNAHTHTHKTHNTHTYSTGWRRLIGSPKLQIIFHKRATKYRSLLWKTTCKDKGSYESSPPCNKTWLAVQGGEDS